MGFVSSVCQPSTLRMLICQRPAAPGTTLRRCQRTAERFRSGRRQYKLVETARAYGFRSIEVIDDDLGRSASGMSERPGFDRLVAWLCAGDVGAVVCFDASRLARNGRDWQHLLELCGLVEARVIGLDIIYDPSRPNDRLLLGMKGSISEFELGVLRARILDAAKARRGELRITVPLGYLWSREYGLELDPDRRLQEVIRMMFARFRSLAARGKYISPCARISFISCARRTANGWSTWNGRRSGTAM